MYAYRLTGERKFYDTAMKVIGWAKDRPPTRYKGLADSLFCTAASRFLDMKREHDEVDDDYRTAQESIVAYGDYYLKITKRDYDRWLTGYTKAAQLLATCYLFAPEDHPAREDYWLKAKQIMDQAKGRWPRRYFTTKQWVMCFSHTGAFLNAEWLRDRKGP